MNWLSGINDMTKAAATEVPNFTIPAEGPIENFAASLPAYDPALPVTEVPTLSEMNLAYDKAVNERADKLSRVRTGLALSDLPDDLQHAYKIQAASSETGPFKLENLPLLDPPPSSVDSMQGLAYTIDGRPMLNGSLYAAAEQGLPAPEPLDEPKPAPGAWDALIEWAKKNPELAAGLGIGGLGLGGYGLYSLFADDDDEEEDEE